MATASSTAFQASSNLSLWFKIRGGDELKLSDIQEIIPLRWTYFRDNWEFIKPQVLTAAPNYLDPDFLNEQIKQFSDFIDKQRTNSSLVNPFSDGMIYNRYYAIFDNILIESIDLTNEEQDIINNKVAVINAYSKNDFLNIKNTIIAYRDKIADLDGLSDSDYNRIIGRNSVPARTSASIVDINLMNTLQASVNNVDFVLANLFAVDTAVDPFALARANANNPDINIGQYASSRLVRIDYGEDLESLANRYLGDPNKWLDIAITNGLKPPYIDEVGQKLPLISNGNGNQINIAPNDVNGNLNIDKFYINQIVILQSSTQLFPDQRTVVNIKQIPVSGEIILELNGDSNLDIYKLSEQANIRAVLPNTINSSLYIMIPSTEPLSNDRQEEVPWFLANAAADEKKQKVDLSIDDNGELSFNTNGDFSLNYGLANAVQAIKLKMMTELGSLRYHPEFGLVNIIGNKNQTLGDIKALLIESITNQISIDSRFDRIENLSVDYLVDSNSNTAVAVIQVELSVRLAGSDTVVPISFTVAQ